MAMPAFCEWGWIDCWGSGQGYGGFNPNWGNQWQGYNGSNNMPTIGGANNPNTHNENPDGSITMGGITYPPIKNPIETPIVTNDLLTRIKSFANENPVIVIGGVALVALLLLKK